MISGSRRRSEPPRRRGSGAAARASRATESDSGDDDRSAIAVTGVAVSRSAARTVECHQPLRASACSAMPVAVATFTESAPGAIAIRTSASAAASAASSEARGLRRRPAARRRDRRARRRTRSSGCAVARGVSAATTTPARRTRASAPGHGSSRAHGTTSAAPIAVRSALRYSGSTEAGSSSTPAAPNACALRRMLPTLSAWAIASTTTSGRPGAAAAISVSASRSGGRSAIARQPRWKWKPPMASMTSAAAR